MKLGFVTCHFPPDSIGGGQMQSMRLCEALAKHHQVTVFTRAYQRGLPPVENTGSYILRRRRVFPIPVLKSVADVVHALWQIRSHRKETRVLVSFHIQLAALMVVLAKYLYGTKAVVSPRGLEDFDLKGYKKGFQKFIYTHADLILIQSEKIRAAFLANFQPHLSPQKLNEMEKKIRLFPNGISVPEQVPSKLSSRPHQLIFVGRLEAIKGVPVLLEAFRQCNQQTKLVIIGDGSQRAHLEAMAQGLNVSFLGQCTEQQINRQLQQSRVMVLPSLSENFPNVMLEAFCAGVPVIASAVGAIPELIQNGKNGFLVPPADAAALAQKINALLQSEGTMNQMGQSAYQRVAAFHWPRLVEQLSDALHENE